MATKIGTIVLPLHISLEDWAASLQIDFPFDFIPVLPVAQLKENAQAWRGWATALTSCPSFAAFDIPAPSVEKTWQEWALKVCRILG